MRKTKAFGQMGDIERPWDIVLILRVSRFTCQMRTFTQHERTACFAEKGNVTFTLESESI